MEMNMDRIIMILFAIVIIYFIFFNKPNVKKEKMENVTSEPTFNIKNYELTDDILFQDVNNAVRELAKSQSEENKQNLRNRYAKYGEHLFNNPSINYELIVQLMTLKNDITAPMTPEMMDFLTITITSLITKYLHQKSDDTKEAHRYNSVVAYVKEYLWPKYKKIKDEEKENIKILKKASDTTSPQETPEIILPTTQVSQDLPITQEVPPVQ